MKNSGFTFRKRLASFRYAFNGIRLLIQKEHNAWIHCFVAICVVKSEFFKKNQGTCSSAKNSKRNLFLIP